MNTTKHNEIASTETSMLVKATEIGHLPNHGRFTDIVLSLGAKGLTQSIFQNFDSEIEPVVAVAVDDPDLPKEWTAGFAKDMSQDILDNNLEFFGTKPDGTPKIKKVKICVKNDTKDLPIDPTKLVLPPDREIKVICMTHNRRVNSLHAKACVMELDEIVKVRVLPYVKAKAIAERENVIKENGFLGLSKKDKVLLIKKKIEDGEVTCEADVYNKLSIERADAQALYGVALKCRQSKEFFAQVMSDNIRLVSEINGEEVEHFVTVNDFNNTAGIACKGSNSWKDIAKDVGEKLKPKGINKSKCVSGADIRKMSENAMPLLKGLLVAIADGKLELAKKLVLQELTDLEINNG